MDFNLETIDEYIWQRRIHHGVRRQKGAIPFPESVEIGVEFNVALGREEKIDPSLVTNGVILEISEFARVVAQSEAYFLFEMLEFNFNLGLDMDDDLQYYDHCVRIQTKIRTQERQIKIKSSKWKEQFLLPELTTLQSYTESGQKARSYPKRNRISDTSVLTRGGKTDALQTSEGLQSTDSNYFATGDFTIRKRGARKLKPKGYPLCRELGVTLTVRPENPLKKKLDPSLITNGVMLELLDFTRVLCGSQPRMVDDLIKLNFGEPVDKVMLRAQLTKLNELKKAFPTAEGRHALRKELFQWQNKNKKSYFKRTDRGRFKRKFPDEDSQELEELTMASKRRESLRHVDIDAAEIWQEEDLSYMCPVDFEAEMQPGTEAAADNAAIESLLSETTETETKSEVTVEEEEEEEEVFIHPMQPDTSAQSPLSSHDVSENSETPQMGLPNPGWDGWNLFSENTNEQVRVETQKQRLWIRRADRCKQILNGCRVNDAFVTSRAIGLDFNVVSGNRKKVDLQLFTNRVIWEVWKFTNRLSRSTCAFLLDIFEWNFNLVFRDEDHQRKFICYLLTKEKYVQENQVKRKTDYLPQLVRFPAFYNMDVTNDNDFQTGQEVNSEEQRQQQATSTNPQTLLPQSHHADLERYPFCWKLGVDLWSLEPLPADQKLDINTLTTGAVLEMLSHARLLCGDVRETVNEILEHNFDLDLQNGFTDAAKAVKRFYPTQKIMMKTPNLNLKIKRWFSLRVLSSFNTKQSYSLHKRHTLQPPKPTPPPHKPTPPPHKPTPPPHKNTPPPHKPTPPPHKPTPPPLKHTPPPQVQDLDTAGIQTEEEEERGEEMMDAFDGHMEEVKPAYEICKGIGLDLDLKSKSAFKTKLDLRTLTRAVLLEIHQYVKLNCQRYVPALYEILEYNFDLSSQNHRRVEFAWSIASQVLTVAGKCGRKGEYKNRAVELPFEESKSSEVVCKDEPDDGFGEMDMDMDDKSDLMFVRELRPVDIEVVVD